jgi:hypothetical protein
MSRERTSKSSGVKGIAPFRSSGDGDGQAAVKTEKCNLNLYSNDWTYQPVNRNRANGNLTGYNDLYFITSGEIDNIPHF